MDWIQVLSIIGSVVLSAFYIHKEIQSDIKAHSARMDQFSSRLDQLYQMFIDLLKEGKK